MAFSARILVATSNPGKIRELQEAASSAGVTIEPLPGLNRIPAPIENGVTFEQNAKIKAEYYSRFAPEELLLAEDSGLSVDQLDGAPGVHSARFAATLQNGSLHANSDDTENNRALITELERSGTGFFAGKYVCVIAVARDGKVMAEFRGEVHGELLTRPRGEGGFGYDPLFYFPPLEKTFAELPLEIKRRHSHRGAAFAKFLQWYKPAPAASR